jgi:hypothetical protein
MDYGGWSPRFKLQAFEQTARWRLVSQLRTKAFVVLANNNPKQNDHGTTIIT